MSLSLSLWLPTQTRHGSWLTEKCCSNAKFRCFIVTHMCVGVSRCPFVNSSFHKQKCKIKWCVHAVTHQLLLVAPWMCRHPSWTSVTVRLIPGPAAVGGHKGHCTACSWHAFLTFWSLLPMATAINLHCSHNKDPSMSLLQQQRQGSHIQLFQHKCQIQLSAQESLSPTQCPAINWLQLCVWITEFTTILNLGEESVVLDRICGPWIHAGPDAVFQMFEGWQDWLVVFELFSDLPYVAEFSLAKILY